MRRTLALAAVAAGTLAACAGGDKAPVDTTVAAAPDAATPVAPTVYTINARDYAFESADTIQAGMVTIRLTNQGKELHHVQLVKLDSGHTYAELMEGLKNMKPGSPPPPWIHDVAGPNSPVPGSPSTTEITQELAAGNYAVLCFIPSPDGVPHVMKGMSKSLTIVPSTGPAAPAPAADITVKMTDYAWSITPEITAGKHIIRLENDAAQSHEMFIAKLEPGKTAQELAAWAEKMQGPPPGMPIGGTSGMMKGQVVYIPVDLQPGEYALLCFLPDAKDGKPHVAHGMVTQISVK